MDIQKKYDICVTALQDYVERAGYREVVVGLSGGIDSALVATMCVDAFGAEKVHGALLPGPYSSNHSISDAQELANNLKIEAEIVSIVEPYEAFERVLSRAFEGAFEGVAAENTQARCRMICLMALSNQYGWLLINTGNKSEALMGYSTLYGDTAGAFAPLGGLYKTDVYALSLWRNEQAVLREEKSPIPQSTLVKPPSAELVPGQTDERMMGISYDELDQILEGLYEQEKTPAEVATQGFSLEQVQRIQSQISKTAFKRALEPPFPQEKFY